VEGAGVTHCPDCRAELVALRSINAKLCSNGKCQQVIDWHLAPGQKPLVGSNRQDRKTTGE